MASSSGAAALSETLTEHFGSTPGCDDHFIEKCASARLTVHARSIMTRLS